MISLMPPPISSLILIERDEFRQKRIETSFIGQVFPSTILGPNSINALALVKVPLIFRSRPRTNRCGSIAHWSVHHTMLHPDFGSVITVDCWLIIVSMQLHVLIPKPVIKSCVHFYPLRHLVPIVNKMSIKLRIEMTRDSLNEHLIPCIVEHCVLPFLFDWCTTHHCLDQCLENLVADAIRVTDQVSDWIWEGENRSNGGCDLPSTFGYIPLNQEEKIALSIAALNWTHRSGFETVIREDAGGKFRICFFRIGKACWIQFQIRDGLRVLRVLRETPFRNLLRRKRPSCNRPIFQSVLNHARLVQQQNALASTPIK